MNIHAFRYAVSGNALQLCIATGIRYLQLLFKCNIWQRLEHCVAMCAWPFLQRGPFFGIGVVI